MKVINFMKRPIVTTSSQTPLPEVWQLIFKKHLHSIPVIDASKKLVGIITKEDLLEKVFPDYNEMVPDFSDGEDSEEKAFDKLEKLRHVKAKDVMQTDIIFTHPETNIMRALSRMIVRRVRQLPVVDDQGKLIGLLAKGDIFDGLFKKKFSH